MREDIVWLRCSCCGKKLLAVKKDGVVHGVQTKCSGRLPDGKPCRNIQLLEYIAKK